MFRINSIILIICTAGLLACSPSEQELMKESRQNMQSQNYKEAIKYLDQVITKNNANSDALNMRGVAYLELLDYSKSKEDFTNSIKNDSLNYKPYYNRANVYLESQNYEKALLDYNKAIALRPNNADLYINRATALFELNQYDAALEDNRFAIKLSPNNYIPYLNSAKTLLQFGSFSKADSLLNLSLKINPENGESYYWSGFIKINTDMKEAGCDDLIKAKNRGFQDAAEAIEKFCK